MPHGTQMRSCSAEHTPQALITCKPQAQPAASMQPRNNNNSTLQLNNLPALRQHPPFSHQPSRVSSCTALTWVEPPGVEVDDDGVVAAVVVWIKGVALLPGAVEAQEGRVQVAGARSVLGREEG